VDYLFLTFNTSTVVIFGVRTIGRTDVSDDIMARLRRATASLHAELDAMVAPLLSERAGYRMLLAGLRDAYRVIERELAKHAAQLARATYDFGERRKLGWLDEDLEALSVSDSTSILTSYTLQHASAAFGAVYVIEGATLGGQVIARQVMPALALAPERGCRFFTGYGAETGNRWRETCGAIASHIASATVADAADEAIHGARMTFSLVSAALRARIHA
jgi:heme oxygenase